MRDLILGMRRVGGSIVIVLMTRPAVGGSVIEIAVNVAFRASH